MVVRVGIVKFGIFERPEPVIPSRGEKEKQEKAMKKMQLNDARL